jgi:hypothetical protein
MASRYLRLALIREGKTDQLFLSRVLSRATARQCERLASEQVDVGAVLELETKDRTMEACCAVALNEADDFDLLFVHTDGNGNWESALEERVIPIVRVLEKAESRSRQRAVAVIPVRMMEAWALADGDALRRAFGCEKSDADFGLPSPRHTLERESDPKALLDRCHAIARGGRRARRSRSEPSSSFLDRIAEEISLERLLELPSYARFEKDLLAALSFLRIVGPNADLPDK